MQPTSVSQQQMAKLLGNYRLTPATLMAKIDPSWIPAPWLQYLSLEIAKAIARGNCGLLISAPPRHGKSRLITTATPLWSLENFPQKNVVVTTYGEDLSTDFSREIRDFIQNNPDLLTVRLRDDTRRVSNFLTTKGGGLKAVGLRGAITGRGAHVFILDDYIKEPKEAMSATYLEDLWTWYTTVARTRLEPGAVVIIVATRWVTNDIHGRIEKLQKLTGRDFFKIIKLPAIAGPPGQMRADGTFDPEKWADWGPDEVGRRINETLFPARYTREDILDIKTEVGSRWFEAMFQQNPLGDENAAVNPDWFKAISRQDWLVRRGHGRPEDWRVGRFYDMASTKEAGDWTCGARCWFNKHTEDFYIEHMVRGQYSAHKAETVFRANAELDLLECPTIEYGMEQEPGSSGAYTILHFDQILQKARKERNMGDKSLVEHKATTAKLLNSQPLLAAAEAGKVWYVEGEWNHALIDEVTTYPEGAHDDQMDAISGCYKMLSGKKSLSPSWGRDDATRQKLAASAATRGSGLVGSTSLAVPGKMSGVTFGRR